MGMGKPAFYRIAATGPGSADLIRINMHRRQAEDDGGNRNNSHPKDLP